MTNEGGSQAAISGRGQRRTWTKLEEEALLSILEGCVANGLRCDTGNFKSGTLRDMERQLAERFPSSGLKVYPHIESRLKGWKKGYNIISDMRRHDNASGFGWDDVKKCVTVESDAVWNAYIESHHDAKGWRNKPFPLYDRLSNIFGKDRATGIESVTPADAEQQANEEEAAPPFDLEDDTSVNQISQQCVVGSGSQSSKRRKRNKNVDTFIEGMNIVAQNFGAYLEKSCAKFDALADRLGVSGSEQEEVARELRQMGTFSQLEYFEAIDMFIDDPGRIRGFRAVDPDEREQYVRMHLARRRGQNI